MATAPNLIRAAGQAYDNLHTEWTLDALKAGLTSFWTTCLPLFPDQNPNGRPAANWCTLIAALADQMPATQVPVTQLTTSAQFVYRMCWMTNQLQFQGLITPAQGNAVLAAYNASF